MKKILLFLLSMCLFSCGDFGVSSEEDPVYEVDNETGEELPTSSISDVAYAFYSEYKKYVINEDSSLYTGEFSLQAIDSIYAIIENVSGYGMMPASVGIGEVTDTEIAQAFGKLVATYELDDSSLLSYDVLLYDNLDVDENTFISKVMGVFMNENGSLLLADLENMNRDYEAIITLADLIEENNTTDATSSASSSSSSSSEESSESSDTDTDTDSSSVDAEDSNTRANIVYTATNIIRHITVSNFGVGITSNTLPNDEDLLSDLSAVIISAINSNGINLTVDTPDFDVSLIYTDDFIAGTLAPIFRSYYGLTD